MVPWIVVRATVPRIKLGFVHIEDIGTATRARVDTDASGFCFTLTH
jgi:hypothetical protein